MTIDPAAKRASGPHSGLVPHDIRITRQVREDGSSKVVATIECERRACRMRVEECASCSRFARIDVHEAGYTMLCHSADEATCDTAPKPPCAAAEPECAENAGLDR